MTIRIATTWISEPSPGGATAGRPLIPSSGLIAKKFFDATAQPGGVKIVSGKIIVAEHDATSADVAAITVDGKHGPSSILWTDTTRNTVQTQQQFNNLTAYLNGKGMSGVQVKTAIGTGPAGRTNGQIEAALTAWLKAN